MKRTRSLVLIALFAAIAAVLSPIRIPLPGGVPLTLQLFAALLTGMLLGGGRALCAQGLYLALGLIGLPLFSGGGGLSYVLHPTFGYLLGMALGAGACGAVCSRWRTLPGYLLGGLVGLLTSYLIGVPWFAGYLCLASGLGPGAALAQAWLAGTLPFLLPDLAKVACAAALGRLLAARLQVLNA